MMKRIRSINENSKNVITNVFNTLIIKGGSIFIGLLTTPAYMRFFDDYTVLGFWFTILSVLSWALCFDIGVGNGLRNRLVFTIINHDIIGTKKYISSSYIFLFSVSILLSTVTIIALFFFDWNTLFNYLNKNITANDLRVAVTVLIFSTLLLIFLRLISAILYALQKAFVPNLFILATNTALLIFMLTCNKFNINNNIKLLSIAYLFAVNTPLLIATTIVFSTKLNNERPSLKYFDKKYAIETLKYGGSFLIIQITAMLINNTSVFLIASLVGADKVVEYNVYFKLFSMVSTFYGLLTVPIWSAVTKSIAEKNYIWIKKTTRTLQVIAIAFSIGQFIIFPFLQRIFDLWLGEKSFRVDFNLMVIFAIEQIVMIWSLLNASISNGLNELKLQTVLMAIGSVGIFVLAYFFSSYIEGYKSILIAHSIALLPYCIGQSIWLENYFKKKLNQHQLLISS